MFSHASAIQMLTMTKSYPNWMLCAAWCEESMIQKLEHRIQRVVFQCKLLEFHDTGLEVNSKVFESSSDFFF